MPWGATGMRRHMEGDFMKKLLMFAALLAIAPAHAAAPVDVQAYTRSGQFNELKISPTGDHLAATVPLEDRTVLVVMDRKTLAVTANLQMGANGHIADFVWATPDRLLISGAEKFGSLEAPQWTGELFAMNADGSRIEMLSGARVDDGGLGTTIKPKQGSDRIAAHPIPTIANTADDRTALVRVIPYNTRDPYTVAERMDLFTGRRMRVATVPVRGAHFATDNQGVVRYAWGSNADNSRRLYYRSSEDADWRLVKAEENGLFEVPIGFSEDDATAYLRVEQPRGPDSIVAVDLASGTREEVLRDETADPALIGYQHGAETNVIYRSGTRIPLGVFYVDGKPRSAFIQPDAPEARLYRSLEAAFEGQAVEITSQTADGRLALVHVSSDANPGEYYLFDTVDKKADFVVANRDWFDPGQQATSTPFTFTARDGMALHGYVTRPRGSDGQALPMVVMPHGGPFFIQDVWGFDTQAQMLADAGYAVLQLNFRGSAGYGRAYESAGAREWGGKMQDDLTDATRWAIEEGIADRGRICLFGASYGAYASLMGVAKEPDLYRCAAGYVGVYDLPAMQAEDRRSSLRLGNWSMEWVGDAATLAAVSPNRLADRIKAPVFLAAGGEDHIAPIEHTQKMERALQAAGVPVESLYYSTEGHGFYKEAHRREFYTRLLAFLSTHLGGGVAAEATPAGSGSTAR